MGCIANKQQKNVKRSVAKNPSKQLGSEFATKNTEKQIYENI